MKRPLPAMDPEDFCGEVAVLAVEAAGGLARAPDVEAVGLGDVDVLVGILGHARADDGEVFLGVRAGAARVDEGVAAGDKLAITHDAARHICSHGRGVCLSGLRHHGS